MPPGLAGWTSTLCHVPHQDPSGAGSSGAVARRALLLAGGAALLAGCTAGAGAGSYPVAGSGASSGGAPPAPASAGASGAHDPGWVKAENARRGSRGWRIPADRVADEQELGGYTDAVSVTPGADVALRLSSALGPVTVTAYRLGHYGGAGARRVWTSAPLPGGRQATPTPDALGTVRCEWPVTATLRTSGWPEGSYLLRLDAGGKARYVPLTLRSTSTAGRLVLVSSVASYQAYNQWGGHSLYKGPDGSFGTRARVVSFDRPYDLDGARHVLNFEIGPVQLAESLGLDLAYLTSWEVHHEVGVLDRAAGCVSLGHDEYWTVPMRTAVERARDAGTNLAFLGANAVYWRIRLDATGRLLTCYKSGTEDPITGRPETTAMWRAAPRPEPENRLTGMLYEAFPADADLVIHDPGFFLFEGLGLRRGDRVPGIVATEIDRAYPIAGTPTNLQVVAHSPVPIAAKPPTWSDMTYYTAPSGAGVLSVGTMGWCTALRGPSAKHRIGAHSVGFARTVTSRLFTAMASRPLGQEHPAHPNLAGIGESVHTSTGSGGPVSVS